MVGLELCADAVKDAQLNAVNNNVSNCEFQVGLAEDTIPKVCVCWCWCVYVRVRVRVRARVCVERDRE